MTKLKGCCFWLLLSGIKLKYTYFLGENFSSITQTAFLECIFIQKCSVLLTLHVWEGKLQLRVLHGVMWSKALGNCLDHSLIIVCQLKIQTIALFSPWN